MKNLKKIKIEDFMSYEISGKVKLLPDTQTFGSGFKKREINFNY